MEQPVSIFTLFGGIRPMARALGENPSAVMRWKQVGRIPAEKQPHALAVGQSLGLPITAENVVFPLGRPADGVAGNSHSVVCGIHPQTQQKGPST